MKQGVVYIDDYLYLPKEVVNMAAIEAALTLTPTTSTAEHPATPIIAYEETTHHVRVPRAFLSPEELPKGVSIIDRRPKKYMNMGWESTIDPRDEGQATAMHKMSTSDGGIIEMGCGKGKTVVALEAIARIGEPALIVVNNTTHIQQWVEESKRWLGVEPTVVRGAKQEYDALTVAMLHTVVSNPPSKIDASSYGVVVFDEAHHLSAPWFNQVCPMFKGKRFGLTATKHRTDGLEGLYLAHIGKVLYTDLSTELIPDTFFIKTGIQMTPDLLSHLEGNEGLLNVPRLRSLLADIEPRNRLIIQEINEARANGRRILVLGHIVRHLEYLHTQVPDSGLCVGRVSPDKRHKILKEKDVVFGTTQLAAEGLNAPWLDTLFIITPFKAMGLFQQAIGRILRTYDTKRHPLVIVFEDQVKSAQSMLRSLKKYLREHDYPFEVLPYDKRIILSWSEETEEVLYADQVAG